MSFIDSSFRLALSGAKKLTSYGLSRIQTTIGGPVLGEAYAEKMLHLNQDRSGIDERFVTLSLVLDQRQQGAPIGPERWQESVKTYQSLELAVADNPNHVLVVVGEPGAEKSTLANHFARHLADNDLRDKNSPIPFLVALRKYESGKSDPPG